MRSVEEMLGSLDVEGDWEESPGNLSLPEYYVSYDGQRRNQSTEVASPAYQTEGGLADALKGSPAGEAVVESALPYVTLTAVCTLPILPDNIIEDMLAWRTQILSQYIHDSMPWPL